MQAKILIQTLREAGLAHYDAREAEQIAYLTAAHLVGLDDYTAPLRADQLREWPIDEALLHRTAERLRAGEPMQYILGQTDFYGRIFAVDHRVLIPRPETEELVDRIRRTERSARRLLDVGTGSGCIAISLALELPEAQVSAVDISLDALAVARHNAEQLGATVDFHQADALQGLEEAFTGEQFDVIVSNPPYVPDSDRETMHCNVLDHEPALALFVPDDDPLRFYRAIAQAGRTLLRDGGALYFEIYHALGDEMIQLLEQLGYKEVTLYRDLQDKPRMLCGRKASN
ncbi:MAG: peptide chain release factor N(5)-glutamine methyltransferase [Alistipes sp.]|nr:peptide chain release factor N(5)-glutamine methyltransferase [Alistipes sp.]